METVLLQRDVIIIKLSDVYKLSHFMLLKKYVISVFLK